MSLVFAWQYSNLSGHKRISNLHKWFHIPSFFQLTSYQGSSKTKWEQADIWLVNQSPFQFYFSFLQPYRSKPWTHSMVKSCYPPITSKVDCAFHSDTSQTCKAWPGPQREWTCMNSIPGARTDTATTGSRQEAVFSNILCGGKSQEEWEQVKGRRGLLTIYQQ